MFLYRTFTNDVDFIDKAYAEICAHSLFTLHLICSFARLKNKHILGTILGRGHTNDDILFTIVLL